MQGEQGRVVAVRRSLASQSIERGHELVSSGFVIADFKTNKSLVGLIFSLDHYRSFEQYLSIVLIST